ncbi:hypothetical protein BT96DRAFT_304811 [Gymnopus androsaceus JB14]|uniref:Uncharacterized protein n=1 Tax=Gymnopus androsaceus JB14 TaxID=1447944 RepID=A0A6A4I9N2_9AGAR|nr:hypothetical protein BT96DRAFT_304811 [Gymnopus androsaceus JB14]
MEGGKSRITLVLKLYQNTVQGAFYNSEQRFPPPKCHPGTRRSRDSEALDYQYR